ncbi:MAG: hypothetical protein HOP12_05045 [Candidatus Eisenbacteria bacterium]|uniref:Anti-sigma factor n=1 Tax=Eiseniibacteriota bacterium TaxID=2212470 RepID=A0A849SDR8_UNCEI|nr:hypothetical protein [Candidatus Eisenbacteria bacterium]
MTRNCVETEDLGLLESLPVDDPRRVHVAACARCQARLETYEEFLAERPLPVGADPAAARAHLRDVIHAQLSPRAPHRERSTTSRPAWTRWLGMSQPVLATVAVLIVAALIVLGGRLPVFRSEPEVLRGVDGTSAGEVTLISARVAPNGTLTLDWRSVSGADEYRLRALDVGLVPVATLPAGSDTSASFDVTRARSDSLAGARYVVVVAFSSGREIADSRPIPLPLP